MAKVSLTNLANLSNEVSVVNTINANNDAIETWSDTVLSRTGASPNTLTANLDANSNRIINLPAPVDGSDAARKSDVDDISTSADKYQGTSVTSVTIGTGSKSFTTQTGKEFVAGRYLQIMSTANPSVNYMLGQVTSYNEDTGALVMNITHTGGSGTYTDWQIYVSGPSGTAGTNGTNGEIIGLNFNFDNATADADPGAGEFRLNNATLASATFLYIDNADANGASATTFLDFLDDSTNTAHRAIVYLTRSTDSSIFAVYDVTGAVVDGTGYRKIPIAHLASNGSFVAGAKFSFIAARSGDKGLDGAGSGDVVGPASVTDGRFVLFDGTTGKLIKQHTGAPGALAVLSTIATAQIDDDAVTYAKVQNVSATNKLLGRSTAGAGNIEEIDVAADSGLSIGSTAAIVDINGTTALTAPAIADKLLIYDASVPARRSITLEDLLKVINSLTNESTIDTANDVVLVYDNSASAVRKTAVSNIVNRAPVLINSWTFSSAVATVAFTDIPQIYSTLMFSIEGVSHNAVGSDNLGMVISTDNGSSYLSTNYGNVGSNGNALDSDRFRASGDAAGTGTWNGWCELGLYSVTGRKMWSAFNMQSTSALFGIHGSHSGTTSAVNAVRFNWDNGNNFDAGTIRIYGI